jgi:hypothetical protein
MPALTKSQIIAANDGQPLEVEVPEWGGSVFIRVMTVGERDAYENEWTLSKIRGMENFRAKLLQRTLCDANGVLLFTAGELDALAAKSAAVCDRLFAKAAKHNGLSKGDVEELAKN